MTSINRQPTGLLGFLGIKNFGRNPDNLGTTLAPTWDLAPWYLNSSPRYLSVASSIVGAGVGATVLLFDAPAGETWYITNFSILATTPVGGAINGRLCRFGPAQLDTVSMTPKVSVGASDTYVWAYDQPFILASGEGIGLDCTYVAATVDIVADVRYALMDN